LPATARAITLGINVGRPEVWVRQGPERDGVAVVLRHVRPLGDEPITIELVVDQLAS
jgi:hypothetical protein